MTDIKCEIKKIRFQNPADGYVILLCEEDGGANFFTAKGYVIGARVGGTFIFGGEWVNDPKWGEQFSIESFDEIIPETCESIYEYLTSGLIKGIGKAYAQRIVDTFGTDTLKILDNHPERLMEVSGIGKGRLEKIQQSWKDWKAIKEIVYFFEKYKVSIGKIVRIYKEYGEKSIEKVKENPYRLADDIWGFGFKTADEIAMKLGFGLENFFRLRSGILFALNELASQGHCFADRNMLYAKGMELLQVDDTLISMTLDDMIQQKEVVVETLDHPVNGWGIGDQLIYLKQYYFSEVGVSNRLNRILFAKSRLFINMDGLLERVQYNSHIQYDAVQLEAIRTAVSNKVLVLTGGPGTGKTTTTLGIIHAFREAKARILLAAPTGRAAKRLSEATGMPAMTIHRLLGAVGMNSFSHDERDPLSGDVLIVDECSMIDVTLMNNLLKAVPDEMRVILVGDVDQLPSVGAGNVLRDIILSHTVAVVKLTRIFRQAQASRIVTGAHMVNTGKMPDISNVKPTDLYFKDIDTVMFKKGVFDYVPGDWAMEAADEIVSLVSSRIPAAFGYKPTDIQVLSPMRKGDVGVLELNRRLQMAINPRKDGVNRGSFMFKIGDKVMQTRNNYDKKVFNGDMGRIVAIDQDDHVVMVRFDSEDVEYDFTELDELILSYASTIHRSQGSEYPVVVMPMLMNHFVMLQRNLIYTGMTRAKKLLVIVGTKKAMNYAVRNAVVKKRNTLLWKRLQDKVGNNL